MSLPDFGQLSFAACIQDLISRKPKLVSAQCGGIGFLPWLGPITLRYAKKIVRKKNIEVSLETSISPRHIHSQDHESRQCPTILGRRSTHAINGEERSKKAGEQIRMIDGFSNRNKNKRTRDDWRKTILGRHNVLGGRGHFKFPACTKCGFCRWVRALCPFFIQGCCWGRGGGQGSRYQTEIWKCE